MDQHALHQPNQDVCNEQGNKVIPEKDPQRRPEDGLREYVDNKGDRKQVAGGFLPDDQAKRHREHKGNRGSIKLGRHSTTQGNPKGNGENKVWAPDQARQPIYQGTRNLLLIDRQK